MPRGMSVRSKVADAKKSRCAYASLEPSKPTFTRFCGSFSLRIVSMYASAAVITGAVMPAITDSVTARRHASCFFCSTSATASSQNSDSALPSSASFTLRLTTPHRTHSVSSPQRHTPVPASTRATSAPCTLHW